MFEKFLRYFVENVRMNYLLFVLLFALGVVSYIKMPKEIFPTFDLDMITVNGHYSGASVDTLDKIIVQELEDDLKSIQGVDKISSVVKAGSFTIILELKKGQNRYNIASKAKDTVDKAKGSLPSDMDDPVVSLVDLTKKLMEIVVYSESLTTDQLKSKANQLKSLALDIKDIQEVKIYGDSDIFFDIIIDEKKVNALDMRSADIYNALKTISYIYPIGTIESYSTHYLLSTANGAKTAKELKNTKIKIKEKVIYLQDIAVVKKRYENTNTIYSINNKNALNLTLSQNKNGNAITIEKDVKKLLNKLNKKDPQVSYKVVDNQSKKIKTRLNIVTSNILLGLIIITLITALLINTRMAFVIMIGIPTSFVIASTVFFLAGYSINLVSLVGVLLALGIIVDDAIVVSEHIQQYIEEGLPIKEAVIKGANDMVKPVTIASLTTLFAFLPSLMLSGTMGEVIKLIPIALSALIVASLIESFIFLPIHALHTLKKDAKTLSWKKINKLHYKTIHFIMEWKRTFLAVFIIGVPILTFVMIKNSHFQMFPSFDTTTINIALKSNVNTTVQQSDKIVKSLSRELLKHKDKWSIKNISSIAGYRRDSGGNSESYPYVSSIAIELYELKPQNFVDRYITPIFSFYYDDTQKIRAKTSQTVSKEINNFLLKSRFKEKYNLIDLSVVQKKVGPIKADIKIGLISNDIENIDKAIKKLKASLNSIDGVESVASSTNYGIDELKLKINEYGLSLGVDEGSLGQILSNRYLELKKSTTFDSSGMIDIKIKSKYKDNLTELKKQTIELASGQMVALEEICDFEVIKTYEKITKDSGETNFFLFSNVDTKIITASEVLDILQKDLEAIKKSGIKIVLKGEAEKNRDLINDMKLATSLAMLLILLSMIYLFNSFRQTFIVMSVIPFSLLGGLVGHTILGVNLGMTSMIGALGLAGIVINDGIIMMTYLRKSKTIEDVFYYSAKRFRPIILTTVTTLIGISTLIFFPTGQAVIFQPMAIALGFGLAWGTVLNLIYLPVLYGMTYRLK
ncbi:MAG: acriflavin resistance protein [Campylobacteraceae bacterium 4484_166]|nr:MAG: acriflavin resistance protein [Campylobacteraceae bacterium 4484_166]